MARRRQRAPLMAVEILVGTDVHVLSSDGSLALRAYVPNLQARGAAAGGCRPRQR